MLSFELGEELSQIQSMVRTFAQKQLRPALRQIEAGRPPPELLQTYAELGVFGLDWPQEAGGAGMGRIARALVEEELAFGDLGAAFWLDRGGAAAELCRAVGTAAAHQVLRGLIAGGGRLALAAAEEGKAQEDFKAIARRQGAGWILSGKKSWVTGAKGADQLLVLAQVEQGKGLAGAGLFLVKVDSQGLRVAPPKPSLGLLSVAPCEVFFEGLELGPGARLEVEGSLLEVLRRFYDSLSVITAARAVGAANTSFEYARAYAEERVAFGKPIGHFQAIAFLLSDMATAVDAARWLCWKAAWANDRGPATSECAAAQSQALEAAFFCANSAVQILGGAGYLRDHPVEKWMRDVKALSLYGLHAQAASATLGCRELGKDVLSPELFPLPSLHAALT